MTMAESLWTDLLGTSYSQRYYDANGIRTRVLESGDPEAPALLMMHGVNGHAETYTRNIGAHADDFHVIAPDFIGHGFTDKPLDRTYEIPTYVQHIADLMDGLGIERAALSGESLGAWVAVRFLLTYPERVERLVLNTPGGMNANPKAMESLRTLTRDAVTDPTREKVRRRLEWLFKHPSTVTEDLVETRFRIYAQPGYREATELTLCLQDPGTRKRNMLSADDLQRIDVPTLLVWSTADPVAGVEVGEWCHGLIAGSQLVYMRNSGHWPQFEEAELFNELHLAFLRGQPAPETAAAGLRAGAGS
jgi:2-hydroxy-6-oxonona-2,4-dienedioate hydrolase